MDRFCHSCDNQLFTRINFWGKKHLPLCDKCFREAKALRDGPAGVPRIFAVLGALIVAALLIGLCGACDVAPTAPQDPPNPQVGFWYTDAPQTLCTENYCYRVEAEIEVFEDGTCDYTWDARGIDTDNWGSMTPIGCTARPGDGVIKIYSVADVHNRVAVVQRPVMNFTLYAVGPGQQSAGSRVTWGDLELVRRAD